MEHNRGQARGAVEAPSGPPGRAKKAYHTKTKTGCRTCRIRRIRCDEERPVCERCSSTGRNCDWFGLSSPALTPSTTATSSGRHSAAQTLGSNAAADLILLRWRKSPEELRSYRYFREVLAPSLAGAMGSSFWLSEIPRICHSDQAIWHAAVSLGYAYEAYVAATAAGRRQRAQTLWHFNASIRELTGPSSLHEPWKTLTASAIFACICVLEGELEQAALHFRSGCRLLRECEGDPPASSGSPSGTPVRPSSHIPTGAISLASVRSILTGFEMTASKLDADTTSQPPMLYSPDTCYASWKLYRAPETPSVGRCLTADSLSTATKAAEALFVTLIIASTVHANRMKDLYADGGFEAIRSTAPYRNDDSHALSFEEIEKAVVLFGLELNAHLGANVRPIEMKALRKAYLSLRVIQASSRLLLYSEPQGPGSQLKHKLLPAVCENIVDLAEEAMSLDATFGCCESGRPVCTGNIINPLSFSIKAGFHRATRERALRLLRRPRLEGVLDSRLAGYLMKAMMARETAATEEYRRQHELAGIVIDNPTAQGWDGGGDDSQFIHPLARICNYNVTLMVAKEAKVVFRTWKEWLQGSPGEESYVRW